MPLAAAPARLVLDTNVIISAALRPDSAPAEILRRSLQSARLVFSDATFAELQTRLWKPKFDRYVTIEWRRQLLHDLAAVADWVDPKPVESFCRDPSDDAFIHAALAGGARWLVSGDDDLLVLQDVRGVRMLAPRAALEAWPP